MKKKRFRLLLTGSLLALCTLSQGQTLEKDSLTIQSLINKKKPQTAGPAIITIDDKATVDLISKYIDRQTEEKQKKEAAAKAKYNSAHGRRYMLGDTSVLPEILTTLNSNNPDAISALLDEMTLGFDRKEEELILDPSLKQAIFKLIENEELEHLVVQFLGINHVEGSAKLFENRLLSGKSSDKGRLFYWISQEDKSEKVVNYISDLYSRSNHDFFKEDWIFDGISKYMKKGSPESKKKILDICFDYVEKHPVNKEDFKKEPNDLFINVDIKMAFLSIITEYGDQRALPFFKKLEAQLSKDLKNEKGLGELKDAFEMFLIRFENEANKLSLTRKHLEKKDSYFDLLEMIRDDVFLKENKTLDNLILSNFEKLGFRSNYNFDRIISHFKSKDKKQFHMLVADNIKSKAVREKLLEKFTIDNYTFDEINSYLHTSGIIDQPISDKQVEEYKKTEYASEDINSIYTCLEIAGVSTSFDVEVGTIPVDYDNLLGSFVSNSKSRLKNIKSYVQFKENENEEQAYYQFLACANDKCYVMIPEDSGDWYDMATFDSLLKTIIKDAHIKEDFIAIGTGGQDAMYLFGDKKKIDALNQKFELEIETSNLE